MPQNLQNQLGGPVIRPSHAHSSTGPGHPYIQHHAHHFPSPHSLSPLNQHGLRQIAISSKEYNTSTRCTRADKLPAAIFNTQYRSKTPRKLAPQHDLKRSRLRSKRLFYPCESNNRFVLSAHRFHYRLDIQPEKNEPAKDIFIQELSHQSNTSSPLQVKYPHPQNQVPLRASHAPTQMRRLMSVFRLNPFAIQHGIDGDTISIQWKGQEAGPLTEEPQIIEFQLESTFDSTEVQSCNASQKSVKDTAPTLSERIDREDDIRQLSLQIPNWGGERCMVAVKQTRRILVPRAQL